ncbi:transcriptional regulator [Brevundimonas vesicularis]|uniref:transcriptional regulator n=1 Tax=Brevundimonas vesicularis TaxID=41276 RepID=UPI0038D4C70A
MPVKKQPTAPWVAVAPKATQSELLRAALSGRRFINENDARLDLIGANSSDYRKIFSMYQGLSMLEALAERGTAKTVSALERAQLARRMEAGLTEIKAYLGAADLEGVRLVAGQSQAKAQTSAAVPRASQLYSTGILHTGSLSAEVEAFQGDVRFGMSVTRGQTQQTVAIDLSEMGATPRTLSAVTAHINSKLEAAGFETRVGREMVEEEPRTLKVGDKTITLPSRGESWALNVRGSSVETVQFLPAVTSNAVYVVQGDGTGQQEVLKFQEGVTFNAAHQPQWVEGQIAKTALPAGVDSVRASAMAPDGSVWMVANVSEGLDNQPIKGTSDVVLMKMDSAGKLLFSRALGAADMATGYALAVDDDGRVAVAGSVVGGLLPGAHVTDAREADSFVSVYAADGTEQWTQRRGAKAADEATAVAFGEDGRIHVAGRAKSAMPGGSVVGGWDGYVQSFSETQAHSLAPLQPLMQGTTQFGTSGDDSVQAMTTLGDKLYTAGVESGRLVVRSFQLGAGGPSLLSQRDLGSIAGGEISGISVENGRVILAGQTRNEGLDIGQINTAHSGGMDAFVAVLSADLTASAGDRLTYVGGGGNDTATDVKIVDGKVWLTGVSDRALTAKDEDPSRGYLSRIDPDTGAVEWSQTWTSDGLQARPSTLVVAKDGASILDRLGLPTGVLNQGDSERLIDVTSLRAGDRFYVTAANSGREVAITIDAKDTLRSLATKIERAAGRNVSVTLTTERDQVTGLEAGERVTAGGVQRLTITAPDGQAGVIFRSGEAGRDALGGLGLSPGYVGPKASDIRTVGIDLPSRLSLDTAEDAKAALDILAAGVRSLRDAYSALAPASKTTSVKGGTVPVYLQNQIANYQAALARLTG